MTVLLMLLASLAIAIATARHLAAAVTIVLSLALTIPFSAAQVILGSSWQPATVLTAMVLLVQVVRDPRAVARDVARLAIPIACIVAFLVAAFLASYFASRTDAFGTVVLQIGAPLMLLIVIRRAIETELGSGVRIARALVALTVAEALLIVLIGLHVAPQPWSMSVQASRWWSVDPTRVPGTLDHPLVAALWLASAVPFAGVLTSVWLRTAVVAVLVAGIMQTGSRTGLVVAACCGIIVVIREGGRWFPKLLAASTMVLGGVVLFVGDFGSTLAQRFADDAGSSSVRFKVLELAGDIWPRTIVLGKGAGASEEVTRNALIGSTFENPFLMYMVDFGGLFAVLLVGGLVGLVVARPSGHRVPGARLAAFGLLVGVLGFNSLSSNAAVGSILFTVIALAVSTREPESGLLRRGDRSSRGEEFLHRPRPLGGSGTMAVRHQETLR